MNHHDEAADAAPVRVDAWTWSVRLFPTRSAAAAACRAGHVKVNNANVKPAHILRKGDTVRAVTPGGERIVIVVGLIARRVSAAVAAEQYEDRTPPPPTRDERAMLGLRDRGAGRPTKRDRREIERLRGRS